MSTVAWFMALGLGLFLIGLHGLLSLQNTVRRVIAVNIMGGGVFLVMVSLAARIQPIDPVMQALVVTGLVVAVSATAFALRLSRAEDGEP